MNFDFTNLRVSGTIGVEDVPLDVLLKVRDYLEGRMKESNRNLYDDLVKGIVEAAVPAPRHGGTPAVEKSREAEPADKTGNAEEKPDEVITGKPDDPHTEILQGAIASLKYSGRVFAERILDIFKAVLANPDGYKWEYVTTYEWRGYYESLSVATRANIGGVLGDLKGHIKNKNGYNVNTRQYENRYELPVPVHTEDVPAEEEVKAVEDGADALNVFVSEDKRKGEAVRKARNEAGFSVRELADLIGYDSSIIVNWENGLYKISPDAEDALKKLFGDNLFNNKEGEAE